MGNGLGRRLRVEKTPGNPGFKSVSLPYRAVLVMKHGVEAHPERMYNGVADVIISMLRNNPDYLEWEREYDEQFNKGEDSS